MQLSQHYQMFNYQCKYFLGVYPKTSHSITTSWQILKFRNGDLGSNFKGAISH